jgi:hypothetical protein
MMLNLKVLLWTNLLRNTKKLSWNIGLLLRKLATVNMIDSNNSFVILYTIFQLWHAQWQVQHRFAKIYTFDGRRQSE